MTKEYKDRFGMLYYKFNGIIFKYVTHDTSKYFLKEHAKKVYKNNGYKYRIVKDKYGYTLYVSLRKY